MLEPGNSAAVLVFRTPVGEEPRVGARGAGGVLLFNARIPASEALD